MCPSLRALSPAGDARAATISCARCEALAAFLAAPLRDAGPERRVKLESGCDDCGWAEWARGLDWDHVGGVKIGTIAIVIANGRPWSGIEAEMAKCELVCANCHRVRTCERRVASRARGAADPALTIPFVERLRSERRGRMLSERGG